MGATALSHKTQAERTNGADAVRVQRGWASETAALSQSAIAVIKRRTRTMQVPKNKTA